MIGMFSQILRGRERSRLSRANAGVCVLFWVIGSLFTLYGSLTPEGSTVHCPHGQSNGSHHDHGHCAWHCVGVESQPASDRLLVVGRHPTALTCRNINATRPPVMTEGRSVPRGPPHLMFSEHDAHWRTVSL